MRNITLGMTGITTPQNAFGALPIQRVSLETAVTLLRRAHEGGMTFFDTARAYSDSEIKVGADYLDIYQFHCVSRCYAPGDGTGMYEAMLEAKKQGKIRHIGITAHLIAVAEEIAASGLYETLQFPFSYLASEREIALVRACEEKNMGFIAMKGLAGGLLTNSRACMAFMSQFEALPIWGIQREEELDQWLSFFSEDVTLDEEISAFIEEDKKALQGDFCRGCGYCMPCTAGIQINQCARMSQLIRRAPSENFKGEFWQKEMAKIEDCVDCGLCKSKCPYGLDTPNLLRKNLADYRNIISGAVEV